MQYSFNATYPLELSIFSLYPRAEAHVQAEVAQVRASVTYLGAGALREQALDDAIVLGTAVIPDLPERLEGVQEPEARRLYQSIQLAAEVKLRRLDVIHAHFATSAVRVARCAATAVTACFAQRSKVPCVVEVNAPLAFEAQRWREADDDVGAREPERACQNPAS